MTKNQRYDAILIFGPPGVGKGSQAKLLCEDGKYVHFSTGNMFRDLDINTEVGAKVRSLIDHGTLVPDDLTIRLFKQTLEDYRNSGRYNPSEQTLILDGIPRNPAQVDLIDPIINVKKIIYLFSDDATLIERLTTVRAKDEGRDDDKDEAIIRKRLETYRKETEAVLDKYDPSLIERVESKGVGTMKIIDAEIRKRIANWTQ